MTLTDHAATAGTRYEPLLSVRGLTKDFPGLRALDGVSLEVGCGEIVALLGQNGSGKSTLVKILAGVYSAQAGSYDIGAGDSAGSLHFIHQDLGLVETLSTVENLALGTTRGGRGLRPVRRRPERQRAKTLLARFGITLEVDRPVGLLTPAQRTIVAIARAMDGWTGERNLLVLDEPTASLHGEEVGVLFRAIRQVSAGGAGVLFISHRLEEVTDLADRIVVLRDGRVTADVSARGLNADRIAALITGSSGAPHREPAAAVPPTGNGTAGNGTADPGTADPGTADPGTADPGTADLGTAGTTTVTPIRVTGLSGGSLRHLDLSVGAGEIVGITGTLGSGREDVAGLIYGATPRRSGTVSVAGSTRTRSTPNRSLRDGIAFIPADRKAHGAAMSLSLRENLTLPLLSPLQSRGRISASAEKAAVADWTARVEVQPALPERPLGLFSGGNQQKVVIARWLRVNPAVLLVEEPTQGVDVGASEAIRALIIAAARRGMAVLIASSDNTDLVRMCSRVIVLRDGVSVAELGGSAINDHRLTQECLGETAIEKIPAASRRA